MARRWKRVDKRINRYTAAGAWANEIAALAGLNQVRSFPVVEQHLLSN